MITLNPLSNGEVLVTFMVDDERPVSVVGDFNDWDPFHDPLVEDAHHRRAVTVAVPADSVVAFRYLADGGEFYDDPDADRYEPNGYGQTHGVLAESLQVPHTATTSPSHEPRTKQRSPVPVTAS